MITDILTIVQKELREIILARAGGRINARGSWLNLLLIVAVFGIFLPWQNGPDWVESPGTLFLWAWVPLFLVSAVIADSFAGERERHTLETLLASRLSDRAILLGKVAAAVIYGWGIALISVALGLVTVNVAYWDGALRLYPLDFMLAGIVLALLGATLSAAAGVLVSLRADSVRQAAQTMSLAIMVLLFVPVFGLRALPAETQGQLVAWVAGRGLNQIVLGAMAALLALDLGLLAAGMARFRRARLILD